MFISNIAADLNNWDKKCQLHAMHVSTNSRHNKDFIKPVMSNCSMMNSLKFLFFFHYSTIKEKHCVWNKVCAEKHKKRRSQWVSIHVIYLFGQRFKVPGTSLQKYIVKPLAYIMYSNENTLLNYKEEHHMIIKSSLCFVYINYSKILSKH